MRALPDRSNPEPDQIARTDQLDRRERGDRSFDDDAEPDGDEEHLHVDACSVAEHRHQRIPASEHHRPADHEHHARAGDHDQRKRQNSERHEGSRVGHVTSVVRPRGYGQPTETLPRSQLRAAESEEVLADLAHLDLLGALRDAVTTVVTIDVLEGHVP